MNLIIRLLLVVLRLRHRAALEPLGTSVLGLRVWPTDLDILMHMTNSRYLSMMDLGRIDLLVRTGFWREARRRQWQPVVGAGLIDYRKSLRVFKRFELQTRVAGWDEKWFYIEQQFVIGGEIAAKATMKIMIRSRQGAVSTVDALETLGISEQSPELPAYLIAIEQHRRH